MARLTQQTAIIGIGRLLNMAAGAATLMVLARVLPNKEDYGAVCQLIVLYMVLSQVFAVGLPQSNYYFLPRFTGGQRRGFLTQTVTLLMLSGALLGAILFFGADLIGHLMHSPKLPVLLRIFAVYPIFMMPTLVVESTLLHRDRPVATVVFNAIVRVGMFCGLVIPSLMHLPLSHTITVWMIVAGGMWLSALLLIFSTVRDLPFQWHPQMLHEELTISLPLAIGTLLAISTAYLDRFIVSHFFGPAVFGTYTNASLEVPTVSMVTNAMAVVLTSELCKQQPSHENLRDLAIWRGAVAKSAIVLFASLGFLAFWGPETMRIFFSDRFADSGTIFTIYVWVIPMQMIMLQPLLIARGVPHIMIYVRLVAFASELLFVLSLGYLFGLLGIALGVVIAQYVATAISTLWFTHRFTHIGWRAFFPWRVLGLCLLVAMTAGGSSWLVHLIRPGNIPLVVKYGIGLFIFLTIYLVGMYLVRLTDSVIPVRFLSMKSSEREGVAV